MTKLINYARAGSLAKVRALLQKGADANARDKNGSTALVEASTYGQLEVVRELLTND